MRFQDIFFLLFLSILDLSCNKFFGEIPASIGNLTNLETLVLNNNEISGYIPSHKFSPLFSLSKLDFSYNKFSGEIPESIGSLTNLNILKLNKNEFTSKIPHQIGRLTHLTEFSVANNLLSAPVLVFDTYFDVANKKSYWNNSGLCGGPLEPCERDPFHLSFREGLIAGYVFSAASVVVVYMSYFVPWTQLRKARRKKPVGSVGPYYSYIRRRREREQHQKNQMYEVLLDLPEKRYQSLLHLNLQEKRCQEVLYLFPSQTTGTNLKHYSLVNVNVFMMAEDESLNCRMSFQELRDAPHNFGVESIIGVGTTSITYKARLPNSCFVAVKRLYDSQFLKRQFQAEIMILERYKHKNIVSLLGFLQEVERKQGILVYRYMPNGRL